MFHKKSYRFISLISFMILLTNVLPVQAKTPASPLAASGDLLWAKSMGSTDYDDGFDIAVDTSGNVYTIGLFAGTVDFDPGAGTFNLTSAGEDIFISKFSSNGDFLWAISMGGRGWDEGSSIALDSAGNIYATGYFEDTADFDPGAGTAYLTSAGSSDIFVSKLDSSGNFVWAKSLGGANPGIFAEYGTAISLDSSGNVYTTGNFKGTADFDPGAGTFNLTSAGADDIFVSKLDNNGNFVWAQDMGGASADSGRDLAVDDNGNVYTTGYFQAISDFDPGAGTFNLTPEGGLDIFISKLDGTGNFVWAKSIGGTGRDTGLGLILDSSGNVYTTGSYNSTVDFDPGAGTFDLTSAGAGDIFVSKLDGSGNFIWAKGMGGTSEDLGRGIALDPSNNVYTLGAFQGTADFDPSVGAFNLTSAGLDDVFVSKLDNSGNFIWAKGMGGTDEDFGTGIAVDSGSNVYSTGYFSGTADFDPSTGISNLTSAGSEDIFISKLEGSSNQALQVTIDIKPGSTRNEIEIKPGENGNDDKVSVAILSTTQFNAPQQVEKSSLTFGASGAENSLSLKGRKHLPDCQVKDVNRDGLADLVCKFTINKTGFKSGDTQGILKGILVDGAAIEGSDLVAVKVED